MRVREFFDVYRGYRIPRFKLIEHRNWWFTFSGILIVLSLVGITVRGFKHRNKQQETKLGKAYSKPEADCVIEHLRYEEP